MIAKWILVTVWFFMLLLVEPFIPYAWAVGGALAWIWVFKSRWILGLAFIAGMVIDLYWGRTLGLSSLGLLLTLTVTLIIHEHFSQWWVLILIALGAGILWSVWFYATISVLSVLGCLAVTVGWYSVNWYFSGKRKGVYLRR